MTPITTTALTLLLFLLLLISRSTGVLARQSSHELLHTTTILTNTDGNGTTTDPAESADSADSADSESTQGGATLPLGNITLVTGEFAIPVPRMPTSGPTANDVAGLYALSVWIGIDIPSSSGSSNSSVQECTGAASLRAGVDIFWDEGTTSADAWFQWYPTSGASDFANFAVVPGDVLRVTVTADSLAGDAGTVVVEQLSSLASNSSSAGNATVIQSASQTFTDQNVTLCRAQAAWVVEDFAEAGIPDGPVALANFSALTLEKLEARTADGRTVSSAKGARVFDIELQAQGGRLTDCEVGGDEGGEVTCVRVVGSD